MIDFVCIDCGFHIHAFGLEAMPEPPRCQPCQWLAGSIPAERAALRAGRLDAEKAPDATHGRSGNRQSTVSLDGRAASIDPSDDPQQQE
jgi:hypothetical protein